MSTPKTIANKIYFIDVFKEAFLCSSILRNTFRSGHDQPRILDDNVLKNLDFIGFIERFQPLTCTHYLIETGAMIKLMRHCVGSMKELSVS